MERHVTERTRSLRNALVEGFVIVASILIAFALDASWDSYQEARAEQEILRSLLEEFEEAAERIAATIEVEKRSLAASASLMDHIGPTPPDLASDSLEALVVTIFAVNTLEVPAGALNSLLASGDLGLISSDSIQDALTRWPALVSDVRENHDWQRETTDDVIMPHISRHVAVRSAARRLEYATWEPSSFTLDPGPLQRDPVFEGLLSWGVVRRTTRLLESEVLLDACLELVEMVRRELDAGAS